MSLRTPGSRVATFDAYAKSAAMVVCAAFAVTLAFDLRRRSSLYLSAFFALIAMNQGGEAMRAVATTDVARLWWFRFASVAAALDPIAFWLFAGALLERPTLRRSGPIVLLVFGGLALFAGWGIQSLPGEAFRTQAFPLVLGAATVALYATVTVLALRRLRDRPEESRWRAIVPATLVVSILPITNLAAFLIIADPTHILPRAVGFAVVMLIQIGIVGGCIAALMRFARELPPLARRSVHTGLLYAGALILIARGANLVELVTGDPAHPIALALADPGRGAAAIRWLVAGALLSTAVYRDAALGMSLAARRRAARVIVAVGALIAVGAAVTIGLAFVPAFARSFGPADLIVLGIALAVSQSFHRLVDRVANLIYGVPPPGDRDAAHELYRRSVATALAQGRDPARDPELARLRDELGIDAGTAHLLDRLADESNATPLAPGTLVARRYHVDQLLGRGGGGRAFLATDELLHRRVVLKEVPTGDAEDERALREARMGGALGHSNIVVVHDILRRGGVAIIVTEYVAGGTLAERLRRGPLPPHEARAILIDVLKGLAALHQTALVHRDVKPENVLLTAEGLAKIADFGLARRAADSTRPAEGGVPGTLAYMAPEVRAGGRATPSADVYAVGLLTRRMFGPGVPADVAPLVERALAPDPEARWRDAGEMLGAMRLQAQ